MMIDAETQRGSAKSERLVTTQVTPGGAQPDVAATIVPVCIPIATDNGARYGKAGSR
jgi:hypothetical protein